MKKILSILFLSMFILTGCGKGSESTLKCTANAKDIIEMEGKFEVTAKFDSSNKFIEANAVIILNSEEEAKNLCETMRTYANGVTCSDKKVIFEKYTDFAGNNEDYDSMNKSEFKKSLSKQNGVSCK